MVKPSMVQNHSLFYPALRLHKLLNLLRWHKDTKKEQPKVYLIAPFYLVQAN